jgi:hypothetical protein
MTLESVFIWTGFIFLMTILILGIVLGWTFIFDRLYNRRIEWKAIAYAVASNMKNYRKNKDITNQLTMEVGREWYIWYGGKNYRWKCIEVEDRK